jgi:hypothetical protein
MNADATLSPQFQLTPKNVQGGVSHLNTTLTLVDYDFSLDSESFSLPTEAADWLPILLAVAGGFLYGIYKILNLDVTAKQNSFSGKTAMLVGSGLAGFVGYLVANLDLLGIKLDPSVLRTYPLLGFLVAYVGLDAFLKEKAPQSTGT